MKSYKINKTDCNSPLDGQWLGERWEKISYLEIALSHKTSNEHKPETKAKLAYNNDSIFGIFKVEDNYIRSTTTQLQESVCQDSCVEFFFTPKADKGYFNFEFNAGGNMLCHYATDPTRDPDGKITACQDVANAEQIEIFHSLPNVIDPEITTPTTWFLEFRIPFSILEPYCGALGNVSGTEWRANLYKCGDQTSHPHWISWAPLTTLNFHLPDCFVPITFE